MKPVSLFRSPPAKQFSPQGQVPTSTGHGHLPSQLQRPSNAVHMEQEPANIASGTTASQENTSGFKSQKNTGGFFSSLLKKMI